MIRAKLWFRCAVVHDPVTPILVQPALTGWQAENRQIDLAIERAFDGEELVHGMKAFPFKPLFKDRNRQQCRSNRPQPGKGL
jgi:hypothetical protein